MDFKLKILFVVVGVLLFPSQVVLAYDIPVHAYLTNEVFSFYNNHFPDNEISEELKDYLIDGSRREDDLPRWMNHFYDPVHDRGLTYDAAIDALNVGTWQKSKDWARDGENQNKLTYKVPATIASFLSAIQQRKISALSAETNFTWQEAIRYWLDGEKEKAMFTLGHVLHLVEDAAVPDHTRNDPHPPGDKSPYEDWTSKFTVDNPDSDLLGRLQSREPVILPNLNSYFDELAKYSNNNFYSKDTIGIQSGFSLPEPEFYPKKIGGVYFAFTKDEAGSEYPLFLIKKYKEGEDLLTLVKENVSIADPVSVVRSGYWSRLSTKSVQYGSGVINLFFQEVEKAKNDPSFLGEKPRSFLGQIVDAVKGVASNLIENVAGIFSNSPDIQVVEISDEDITEEAPEVEAIEEVLPNKPELRNQEDDEFDKLSEETEKIAQEEIAEKAEEEKVEPLIAATSTTSTISVATSTAQAQSVETQAKVCSFETSQSPVAGKLVINEIAWMGTGVSANDEWIELKNISTSEVDVSGFQILDKDEQIKIIFESGEKIPVGGFYVLERTDDETLPNILANKIYVGALGNSNESLRLFDSRCGLLDEVTANPDWPGGSNSSKGTMERKIDLTWQTSAVAGGTPGITNSVPVQSAGGAGGSASENTAQTENQAESQTPTSSTSTASAADHVLISEILYDASGSDSGNEFVELYNPTENNINLDGWSLRLSYSDSTSSDSLASFGGDVGDATLIKGRSFSLVGLNGNTTGDINRTANLPQVDGITYTITLFDADGAEVDNVSYDSETASEKSLERRSFESGVCDSAEGDGEFLGNGCDTDSDDDFNIRLVSKPQNSESLPEPRDAPTAVINFSVGYHFSTPTLTLDWDESQDYAGATSTITYEIEEMNTPTSSTAFNFNATSTAFEQVIDEVGRNYEFSIKAVDVDGLASTSTVASTTVPSFADNFYFYRHPDASSTEYLIDFYYSDYPFVSDPYWSTPNDDWKIMVFYHNVEAVKGGDLSTASSWNPTDLTNVLSVKYKECSAGTLATNYRMILPDNSGRCGVGGGLTNSARVWSDFEDNHLSVVLASSTNDIVLEEGNDYLTIAFYSFSDSGAGNQSLSLVAIDKTKYYFQNSASFHQSPTMPGNFAVDLYTVNSPTSTVDISWDGSTDIDTLDDLISYEWGLDGSTFEPIVLTSSGEPKKANLLLPLGSTSTIHIRAVDDFSTTSGTTTVVLVLPEAVINTNPDPSNSYFAIDEAKIDNDVLKIKWRLISNPASNGVSGIIPYLADVGAPTSTTIGTARALHRDYGGNAIYPNTTANSAGQCNANITPFSDYTFGWQYETRFSTVSGTVVSAALAGEELRFALYSTNATGDTGCQISNAAGSPLFTGLPVIIE